MDDPCCPDGLEKQDKTNLLLEKLISLFEDGFKIVPINGKGAPPDTGAGACAPAYFDHDTGETNPVTLLQRQKALCITAERYVKEILLKAVIEMLAPDFIAEWIESAIPLSIPLSLQKIEVVYGDAFAGIAALVTAATGAEDLKTIACKMVTQLTGDKNNIFSVFRESVVSTDFDDFPLLLPLAMLVRASNGLKLNFGLFNDAMIEAYEEDLSEYECPCEEPPSECETITLVNGNPTIWTALEITHVIGNTWHIVNHTPDSTGFGVYGASIMDENGCCFDTIANPEGYPAQGTIQYQLFYCDGTNSGVLPGGGGGNCLTKFNWDQGTSDGVDTYVTVIPHVGAIC
jgi:hypothetical protein